MRPYRHLPPVLKEAREHCNLSLADVSRLLGKSRAYMFNVEHGRDLPSPEAILRLAKLFRTAPNRLLRLARRDLMERAAARLLQKHMKLLAAWKAKGKGQQDFSFEKLAS